jgi:hypothetical protein
MLAAALEAAAAGQWRLAAAAAGTLRRLLDPSCPSRDMTAGALLAAGGLGQLAVAVAEQQQVRRWWRRRAQHSASDGSGASAAAAAAGGMPAAIVLRCCCMCPPLPSTCPFPTITALGCAPHCELHTPTYRP